MPDDNFNPYHEWLGLDRGVTQPSFYQLLGLDPGEQNTQRIADAANRAMARARSGRPGSRGAQWAKLLEEVTAAASCLSDPVRRAEYDRQVGRGGAARSYNRPAPRSRVVPTAGGSQAPNAVPLQGPASAALPMQAPQGFPAAYSQNPAGPASYLDPMAPVVPAGPSAAAPGYGQAAPYGAAVMPSYPAPHGHPLPGAPAPVVSGYEYPAAASRRGVPGSVPTGSGTPVAAPRKDRTSSAKVRHRDKVSSVTVLAVSAGVGMVILAVAIVLIILSRKTEDRGRGTHDSFAQHRPIVNAPSPPPETFHRPTPTPRRPRTGERKIRFPAARNESGEGGAEAALSAAVGPGLPSSADPPLTAPDRPSSVGPVPGQADVLTEPTFSPPSGNPPVGSQPDVMSNPKSPTDNNLSLPAFPTGPKLPTTDAPSPLPLTPTLPNQSPAVPLAPKEAMPGQATSATPLPEFKPALSDAKPEPPKPAETPPNSAAVKPEDVATLAKSLQAARAAILNRQYDAAEAELNKVESLPKQPEHHAKYDRLTLLAGYAKNFQSALKQAVAGLHPGDEIEVGNSTVVGFVSAAKDSITLRVTGTNRTYALDSLPAGLAVAIADRWLKKDDPASLAMKGAYVAALKDIDEERRAKARAWLEEASRKGIEGELHKVLDDTYDLEKDAK